VELFSSPLPDPSGYGEGRTFLGLVGVTTDASGAATGTFTKSIPPGQAASLYYTATATSANGNTSEFSRAVRGAPAPPPPTPQEVTSVSQRRVFYNNSSFDGNNPGVDLQDGIAIAPDKQALLPGMVGSFDNVTSYAKGINGLELMLFGLTQHPVLTADDFDLRMGTEGNPDSWPAAPAPSEIALIPVPGPNTLYHVTWPDGAIRNTWLRVTVKANANTGLAEPDVFFFGNLVAETGDGDAKTRAMPRITAIDLAGTKRSFTADAPITSRYDFNRDGAVNALDLAAVRANYGNSLPALAVPIPVVTTDPTAAADADEPITVQILG
jgi:hypothetical protein